jgi:hypothetical protein
VALCVLRNFLEKIEENFLGNKCGIKDVFLAQILRKFVFEGNVCFTSGRGTKYIPRINVHFVIHLNFFLLFFSNVELGRAFLFQPETAQA